MNDKKTIVITGASDGIGAAAARKLKAAGHDVIIVGRSPEKTERVAEKLSSPFYTADYAKLSDVVKLAEELKKYKKIDVLTNNAGAALNKRTVTGDGHEKTFQVNVLAPFLLTYLLLDKLIESKATVVTTSSIASNLTGQKFSLNDIENEKAYTPLKAYGEAKLCNALLTRELNRKYADKGISAVAFEPGVPRTNFACESTPFFKFMYHSVFKYLFTISPDKSAERLIRLALGKPDKDFIRGEIYSYKKPYKIKYSEKGAEEKLWDYCLKAVKDMV